MSSSSSSSPTKTNYKNKKILFVRHGQAMHNPRAEAAKSKGCSHKTFLTLMEEDDEFDAKLTPLGEQQAQDAKIIYQDYLHNIDLVVSSPLSRAIKTADAFVCPEEGLKVIKDDDHHGDDGNSTGDDNDDARHHPTRICLDQIREINGWLLNAKRRTKTELKNLHHTRWNFDDHIPSENDESWTADAMESYDDCGERGYQSLLWLLMRDEDKILCVAHGGIYKFSMVDHPLVRLVDGREEDDKRFRNCELREYEISAHVDDSVDADGNGDGSLSRPIVTLTELKR
jgi:broad specificity phosphatase PhoE